MAMSFEEKSYRPFSLSNIYGLIDLNHLMADVFIVIGLNGKISAMAVEKEIDNHQPSKIDISAVGGDYFDLEVLSEVDLADVCDEVPPMLVGQNETGGVVQKELEVTCCCLLDHGDDSESAHLAVGFVISDVQEGETSGSKGYFWIGTLSNVSANVNDLAATFKLRKIYELGDRLPLFVNKAPVFRDRAHQDRPSIENVLLLSLSDGSLSCYRQMGNRVDSPDSADRGNARPRFTAGLVEELLPEFSAAVFGGPSISPIDVNGAAGSNDNQAAAPTQSAIVCPNAPPPSFAGDSRSMSLPVEGPSGSGTGTASGAGLNNPCIQHGDGRLRTITAVDFCYCTDSEAKVTLVGYQTGDLVLHVTWPHVHPVKLSKIKSAALAFDTAVSVIKCFQTNYFGICGLASPALGPVAIYRDLVEGELIKLCVLEQSYHADIVMSAALCPPFPPSPGHTGEMLFDQDEILIYISCFNKSLLSWRLNCNGVFFEREITFNSPLFGVLAHPGRLVVRSSTGVHLWMTSADEEEEQLEESAF